MYKYILLCTLFLFTNCKTKSVSISPNQEDQIEQTKKDYTNYIYQRTKDLPVNTELSIAILQDGQKEFIGIKRIQDTIEIVENKNKIFEIGSISKVFTSTLLAEFVSYQKLKLEVPIQKYLEFPINLREPINFLQLSNHSSGLPRMPDNFNQYATDMFNPYKDYGENELKEYLSKKITLQSIPGEVSNYSNLGAGLLGYVLTKISDKGYNDLLSEYIYSKYNMVNTTCIGDDIQGEIVSPLDTKGNPVSHWDFNVLAPAGGIFSNISDMAKFAEAQLDPKYKALQLTHQKTISVNDNLDVGLGWHILKNQNSNDWLWHNGGTGGFTTSMAVDVSNQKAVIVLSNCSTFNENHQNIDLLCFKLLNEISN